MYGTVHQLKTKQNRLTDRNQTHFILAKCTDRASLSASVGLHQSNDGLTNILRCLSLNINTFLCVWSVNHIIIPKMPWNYNTLSKASRAPILNHHSFTPHSQWWGEAWGRLTAPLTNHHQQAYLHHPNIYCYRKHM